MIFCRIGFCVFGDEVRREVQTNFNMIGRRMRARLLVSDGRGWTTSCPVLPNPDPEKNNRNVRNTRASENVGSHKTDPLNESLFFSTVESSWWKMSLKRVPVEVVIRQMEGVVEESASLFRMVEGMKLEAVLLHSCISSEREFLMEWRRVTRTEREEREKQIRDSFEEWKEYMVGMRWAQKCQKMKERIGEIVSSNASLKVENATLSLECMSLRGRRTLL